MLDYTTYGLRCYRDPTGVYFSGPWSSRPCQFTVGLHDAAVNYGLQLFPNPGTNHFTLSGVEGYLPPGLHTITLFDAMGRMVLQQRTTDARPVIGTEALPAGAYRIGVHDEQGAVMGATWVKE